MPAEGRELVSAMSGAFGFVPNLGYALGAEPVVLEVYMKMLQALGETVLDPIAQQVALGAASHTNGADYAVAVHATLAKKLGASDEVVSTHSRWRQLRRFQGWRRSVSFTSAICFEANTGV